MAATTLTVALAGRSACAQADPDPGVMTITGHLDLLNQYMFRGLRQNEHPVAGEDSKFGYLSIAGIVTVPLSGTVKFGAWNVHFQPLGDTAKPFNGDKSNQFTGSVGLGFSY